jgi:hypothetical protein
MRPRQRPARTDRLHEISGGSLIPSQSAFSSARVCVGAFLLVVGLAMLGGLVVLGKVYWFSAPLTGICISLACCVASIALSRA